MKVEALSKDRAKLLELLLEESGRAERIQHFSRGEGTGAIRVTTSWAQQRLWFIDQLQGVGAAYNIAMAVRLKGRLEREALCRALDTLVQRHEVLRTSFVDVQGEPTQQIQRDGAFPLQVVDLSQQEIDKRNAQLLHHRHEEARERFDLQVAPLIRGRLIRLQREEHVLLITMHHIVADGWSMGVLLHEFANLYGIYKEGRTDALESLPIQYADYALWQRQRMQGRGLDRQLEFWHNRLQGAPAELELPIDRPRPAVRSFRGENLSLVLDTPLSAELNALARLNGMTLFMVLYAGFAILLSRLSGQDDMVIGMPTANRQRPELESLIGFFVNTLALRVEVAAHLPLRDFLRRVKEVTLSAYHHQDVPFEQVVEAVRPERNLSRHPIFQVMLALQNAPQSEWHMPGLIAELEESVNDAAKFDLLASFSERDGVIRGVVNYDTDILDRETVQRWLGCFSVLLRALASADQQLPIACLPMLPENEQRQVIQLFNATGTSYPVDKCIHELFEQQVELAPHAIAAIWDDQSLTYSELNSQANQLARYLTRRGLTPGDYVPVLMPRSLQMLVGQLAILKCGGVYVPMDPELPVERLEFMMRDCRASLVLTDDEKRIRLGEKSVHWVDCVGAAREVAQEDIHNLRLPKVPGVPAYVMYTSGSTGFPKGVVVPHHAVNRLAINNGYARIEPDDCIAHHSNPSFDASTFEIWGALLIGARVLIVPQPVVLEGKNFSELLQKHRVTVLYMSVGLFNQYTEALAQVFAKLRYLLVGGDSLEPGAIRRVLHKSPPQHLLNAYGPTECTTFSTTHLIRDVSEGVRCIPIGRPIGNAQAYILDSRGAVVPIGVVGELYIGGAGVACGYLNRPELTSERFVPDPFGVEPQARLYRTGDLCRWRGDGTIEYLGRNDHQVKIRGFRIELGEIEAHLLRHQCIREAVVLARQDGPDEKKLVAYVVPSAYPKNTVSIDEVREYLQGRLPDYMVPSAYVVLPKLPLTSTGKVDRRVLPPPELSAYASRQYEAPQGEREEFLAAVWKELLGVQRVGRNDNFFELGGHSLLVLKALFRINQAFGTALKASDAYACPSVRELAMRINGDKTQDNFVDLSQEATLDSGIVACARRSIFPACDVLLTGATGFVGRFLLAQLLEDTNATIHCLMRTQTKYQAADRLKQTLSKWGLWHQDFEGRIVAVPGDLRLPRLGLDEATHRQLSRSVDTIYHCATSMNHLETYAMAKAANVDGVRSLLQFATNGKTKLVNYISTVSVFGPAAAGTSRDINENTSIDGERHSTSNGYAASKWVGEKIIMIAGDRGIPCNIFRLGLVWADTQRGRYDHLQRGYRILKSCLLSGYGIKNFRHDMPPTPVDYVARAVVYLANRNRDGNGIFHISSSTQMDEGVFECCNEVAGTSLKLVPIYDWIREIKRLHDAGQSLPVTPLIEFAFSMNEESFYERQRRLQVAGIQFDSVQTHQELEQAGIVAPALNEELLRLCIADMLANDADLQGLAARRISMMMQ